MPAHKIDEHYEKTQNTHVYLIVVLAVASVATLISTAIIYRNSLEAAQESLKLQALRIAASLEPSLIDVKGKDNIFRNIITEASWEGIAFMALYDWNGQTILHSIENLVGRKIDSLDIRRSADEGNQSSISLRLEPARKFLSLIILCMRWIR